MSTAETVETARLSDRTSDHPVGRTAERLSDHPAAEAVETDRGLAGDTPVQRHLSLLELIATRETPSTLQGLTEETGVPKPTLHRMLQQLEEAGMVLRDGDNRHFRTGPRMRRMAERTLLTDVHFGNRNRILAGLVAELGESCNITALSGHEVVYLDRVETPEPLRVTLAPGSRVPAHASASGKLLLTQLRPAARRQLLGTTPLARFTPHTITDPEAVEAEVARAAERGYAIDDEEYLAGLVCAAVLIPDPSGISNLCVAVQAPALRLSTADCIELVPVLRRAAEEIAAHSHATDDSHADQGSDDAAATT